MLTPGQTAQKFRGFADDGRRPMDAEFEAIHDERGLTTSFDAAFSIALLSYPQGLGKIDSEGKIALIAAGPDGQAIAQGNLGEPSRDASLPSILGTALLLSPGGGTEDPGDFEIELLLR